MGRDAAHTREWSLHVTLAQVVANSKNCFSSRAGDQESGLTVDVVDSDWQRRRRMIWSTSCHALTSAAFCEAIPSAESGRDCFSTVSVTRALSGNESGESGLNTPLS
jgi:hypothetical protein